MGAMRFFENMLNAQHEFDPWPHIVALVVAYLLAIPIGWNREKEDRSAGLRTFPLVAVAACGFSRVGMALFSDNDEAMAGVLQGVVTGIGFIGGGAILQLGKSVRGTATAAGLWATGAIGIAAGAGLYDIAVVLALSTVISFHVLGSLKKAAGGDASEDKDVGADGIAGTADDGPPAGESSGGQEYAQRQNGNQQDSGQKQGGGCCCCRQKPAEA